MSVCVARCGVGRTVNVQMAFLLMIHEVNVVLYRVYALTILYKHVLL